MLFAKKSNHVVADQNNIKNALLYQQERLFRQCINKQSFSSVKFRVKFDLDGMAEVDGSSIVESIHTCTWNSFDEVLTKIVNEFCSEYASESYSPRLESVDILEMYHAEMNFDNFNCQLQSLETFHRQYVVPDALKNNK
jgi:hypothetical protein